MRFERAVRLPSGMFISPVTAAVLAGIKPGIRAAISGGAHSPLFGMCAASERLAVAHQKIVGSRWHMAGGLAQTAGLWRRRPEDFPCFLSLATEPALSLSKGHLSLLSEESADPVIG